MSTKNTVLVAGVHGVSGLGAAEHWASVPGTQVHGTTRRSPASAAQIHYLEPPSTGGVRSVPITNYLDEYNVAFWRALLPGGAK